MDSPSDSEVASELLKTPSNALLRKFSSLGYSLLLRLQSELAAIEAVSSQDGQLEEGLQHKLTDYYTLLDLFLKIQSSKIPHPVILEGFPRLLMDKFHKEIEDTSWRDTTDLMGPFTNHLPQYSLITMVIVSFFRKRRQSKRLFWITNILPNRISRLFVHPDYPDMFVLWPGGISNWLSELVVIVVPTIIVAPMFALYAIHSAWWRMAALWGFAMVFAAVTKYLASSPNTDFIFTTNAAFCAVLVVFAGSALPE